MESQTRKTSPCRRVAIILCVALCACSASAGRVANLNASPQDANLPHAARSTADEVRKAIAGIKSSANAESLVFVMLIGHGSFDAQQAKFNLVGPDLSAKDYAQLIAGLPTRRVVFIN